MSIFEDLEEARESLDLVKKSAKTATARQLALEAMEKIDEIREVEQRVHDGFVLEVLVDPKGNHSFPDKGQVGMRGMTVKNSTEAILYVVTSGQGVFIGNMIVRTVDGQWMTPTSSTFHPAPCVRVDYKDISEEKISPIAF